MQLRTTNNSYNARNTRDKQTNATIKQAFIKCHTMHNMVERIYVRRTQFFINNEDDAERDFEDEYDGDAGLW